MKLALTIASVVAFSLAAFNVSLGGIVFIPLGAAFYVARELFTHQNKRFMTTYQAEILTELKSLVQSHDLSVSASIRMGDDVFDINAFTTRRNDKPTEKTFSVKQTSSVKL